ncbi:MAG: ornithine carbamoyltransferase, ornithine carbamoyltransferase [Candidatus Peregrinibacteria bacterium GW2011_GWC2_39_14]|nr:MAG: ornithine carbamoyltransferase, ornithine carbamoyltransferase [Candidatus Peregrinibacteria bacterium GW2011_GWC2_39_14]
MTKHLTKITDLSKDELLSIIENAYVLQYQFIKNGENTSHFLNKTITMIFEKPSLRTRVAFEVAATQLGGNAIYLTSSDVLANSIDSKIREPVPDIAKNLENFTDIILARVFSHETIKTLAKNSNIPVINGLCDLHHPTQTLADLYTIWNLHQGFPKDLKIAYVGDGCNTANSLFLGCDLLGINFSIATPNGYEMPKYIVKEAKNGNFKIGSDPIKAVKDADIVYTDTWISMGLESEYDKRVKIFKPYQVNEELLTHAKPNAKIMHCLPAHRGEEITAEVIDGPNSLILSQSKSRLMIAKALLKFLIN